MDSYSQDPAFSDFSSSALDAEAREGRDVGGHFGRRSRQHIPGHCSSPILRDDVEWVTNPDFDPVCLRHKVWVNKLASLDKPCVKMVGDKEDPFVFVKASLPKIVPSPEDYDLPGAVESAISLTEIHLNSLLRPARAGCLVDREDVMRFLVGIKDYVNTYIDDLLEDFKMMRNVEAVKDHVCQTEFDHGVLHKVGKWEGDGDLSLIWDKDRYVLMPTSLFLTILDKMQGRFPLRLYWLLCDSIGKYGNFKILEIGDKIIMRMEELRKVAGQAFFTFIKEWDALVKGKVITHEGDTGTKELYTSTKADCDEILRDIGEVNFAWDDILPPDSDHIIPIESSVWLELIGMAKIFGHPTISGKNALNSLRKYGTENQGHPNYTTLKAVMGQLYKDFCKNYYKIHKVLPNIVSGPPEIMSLIGSKRVASIFEISEFKWSEVEFGLTLPYDNTPDCLELIKDSACGVPLKDWYQMYDNCAFKNLHGKRKPRFHKVAQRRVALNFMTRAENDLEKVLSDRSKGIVDYDDRVVYIVLKEGELNVDGRGFTEQTYNQRLAQTSMEHNIASIIFRYVPQQSMTSSDLTNVNRMQGHMKTRPGYDRLAVCLDLKKWCTHQRHHSTKDVGKFYDQIQGTGSLYQESHKFFLGSCIMNGNRLCPPDIDPATNEPIPGDNYIADYLGGLEGMHQKKWTHMAVAVISLAISRSSFAGENMGQGDNQLIILDIPEDRRSEIPKIRDDFLRSLSELFADIGHVLKPLETWSSLYLHEYGKKLSYAGVSISDGTKKASNIVPDVNDGLSSHQTCISTINTATEGIARGDGSPIPAFILNQFLASNFLLRKKFTKVNKTDDLKRMMMCPADMGGLPLSTLYNHSVRGLSDKVSIWISLLKEVQEVDEEQAKNILRTWNLGREEEDVTPQQRSRLLDDIYCLRVKQLPSISGDMADAGMNFLKSSAVKNPVIKTLVNTDYSASKEELVSILCSMNPYPAGVASVIYANSNTGLVENMAKQHTKSKTVEAFTDINAESYLRKSKRCDVQTVKEMKNKLTKMAPIYSDLILDGNCPYSIADRLRELNWGAKVLNATQPVHSHQVVLRSGDTSDYVDLTRSITIETSLTAQTEMRNIYLRRGTKTPYLGGMTGEKLKKTGTNDIVVKTSFEKAYSTLHKLRSYTGEAKNLNRFMGGLLLEKLPVLGDDYNEEKLESLSTEVSSGNVFHRIFSAAESPYAIVNTNPSACTHFKQSSDTMAPMTANGEDYNIFFQAVYANNIRLVAMVGEVTGKILPEYTSTFECLTCTHSVSDIKFDLPDEYSGRADETPLLMPTTSLVKKTVPRGLILKYFAEILAENVDANYNLFNQRDKQQGLVSVIPVKGVSMNDLRRVDFPRIYSLTIIMSKYLRSIVLDWDTLKLTRGHHYALQGLGEILISSSIFPSVRNILGEVVADHNSTITPLGIADYLGSVTFRCMEKYNNTIEVDLMSLLFKDEEVGRGSKSEIRLSKLQNIRLKYSWKLEKKVRTPTRTNIRSGDILALWKDTSPRQFLIVEDPKVVDNTTRGEIDTTVITSGIPRIYDVRDVNLNWGIPGLPYAARTIGVVSSAATKYLEIFSYFSIPHTGLGSIVCMAEGSGSVVTTLAAINPNARIMYNTLLRDGVDTRESPNVRYPPGYVAKGLDLHKIVWGEKFMRGTTDVLDPIFVTKVLPVIRRENPDIITMDAESPDSNGTNILFLQRWGRSLREARSRICVFKMFWHKSLLAMVQDALGDDKWFLWKPVSSNPCSNEVFCVFGEDVTLQMRERARLFTTCVVPYLNQNFRRMSEAMVRDYIPIAKEIGRMCKEKYPSILHLKSKWDDDLPLFACGCHCSKLFVDLLAVLSEVENHKKSSSPMVLNLIRSSNTTSAIEEVSRRCIFLYCLAWRDDITDCMEAACKIRLTNPDLTYLRDMRDNSNPISVSFMGEVTGENLIYRDYKMIFSDRVHRGKCYCRPVLKRGVRYNVITRRLFYVLSSALPDHPWNLVLEKLGGK